jgi:hypothetical protein
MRLPPGQTVQMAVRCEGPCLQAVLWTQQSRSQRALHQERPILGAALQLLARTVRSCRHTVLCQVSIGGADMSVMQVRISCPHLHYGFPHASAVAACAMRRRQQKGRIFLNRRCLTLSGHSISKTPYKASALVIAEARHAKRGFNFTVSDATTAGAAPSQLAWPK